jgi:hypothetical protein
MSERMSAERLAWIRECVTQQWIGEPEMVTELLAELDAVTRELDGEREAANRYRRLLDEALTEASTIQRERDEAVRRWEVIDGAYDRKPSIVRQFGEQFEGVVFTITFVGEHESLTAAVDSVIAKRWGVYPAHA